MPDVSGASAVNTGVHNHYHYAHTRLRVHWAPGIPRALFSKGEAISGQPRARMAPRDRQVLSKDVLSEAGAELAMPEPSRYSSPSIARHV